MSNYLDILLVFGLFFYIVILNAMPKLEYLRDIFAVINMIAWFRGIQYLKIFTATRIYVKILQEVFYDLIAFTVVLITVLLIYATTFSILSNLSND
jgi:hypothetical protein